MSSRWRHRYGTPPGTRARLPRSFRCRHDAKPVIHDGARAALRQGGQNASLQHPTRCTGCGGWRKIPDAGPRLRGAANPCPDHNGRRVTRGAPVWPVRILSGHDGRMAKGMAARDATGRPQDLACGYRLGACASSGMPQHVMMLPRSGPAQTMPQIHPARSEIHAQWCGDPTCRILRKTAA